MHSLERSLTVDPELQVIKCRYCKCQKPLKAFAKNKRCSLGREKTCYDCRTRNKSVSKETRSKYAKTYYQKNRRLCLARNKQYKRKIKQATPPWVNMAEIKQFYQNRPEGYHVDHVIPLKGKLVSGLHVLWNLQYLPSTENIRKGNKW